MTMDSEERKGEYPNCANSCPTQRTISELQDACRACELRTKKYSEIKKPTFEDFFEPREK
jgi:hypothetical protein